MPKNFALDNQFSKCYPLTIAYGTERRRGSSLKAFRASLTDLRRMFTIVKRRVINVKSFLLLPTLHTRFKFPSSLTYGLPSTASDNAPHSYHQATHSADNAPDLIKLNSVCIIEQSLLFLHVQQYNRKGFKQCLMSEILAGKSHSENKSQDLEQ